MQLFERKKKLEIYGPNRKAMHLEVGAFPDLGTPPVEHYTDRMRFQLRLVLLSGSCCDLNHLFKSINSENPKKSDKRSCSYIHELNHFLGRFSHKPFLFGFSRREMTSEVLTPSIFSP
ncbi:hypothetical protein AVEN_106243-1 [Araneus ventricosus]|uniref:Uncharacterized protein n=1 Tax=Araneus ventricosus TaxID=182803 RepID=A0A4Y2HHZ9_ARAVE|nr:hypothetical protein AVEN_106243-1 [Araneus ventricosus]